jgi:hypothetical protein
MPVRSSRLRVVVLALTVPCLLTATAAAQKPGDKDLRAISAYTFTLPKYKQLMSAMLNLGKAAQRNPKMAEALEDSGNLTLDQMVARYSAVAPVKQAIADAGLTPREFAVAQGAMIHAGMSYGIMKQYKLSPDSVSKSTGVSKANLEFFRTNEAEIERMGKEMQAQLPNETPSESSAEGPEGEHGDSSGE